jgi:hypothetical protein
MRTEMDPTRLPYPSLRHILGFDRRYAAIAFRWRRDRDKADYFLPGGTFALLDRSSASNWTDTA